MPDGQKLASVITFTRNLCKNRDRQTEKGKSVLRTQHTYIHSQ